MEVLGDCRVCGEGVDPTHEAWCMECGRIYHLNQRTDLPGKDCGQVWINEDHLALEYACDTCLNPPAVHSLDDILDLDEAAAAAGITPEALRARAELGSVRHRKTAGGTYLFERRDLAGLSP